MARHTRSRRPPLVLASGSPRRRELLSRAGLAFAVDPADIDERQRRAEPAAAYVRRLAREKAEAVAGRHPDSLIVAADTAVVVGARILGKPADRVACLATLRALSGREHRVLTGVALLDAATRATEAFVCRTDVRFERLPAAWMRAYAATEEPYDKAGAYGLQGTAGTFIRSIKGSVTNVVGLPMVELLAALRELRVAVPWSAG